MTLLKEFVLPYYGPGEVITQRKNTKMLCINYEQTNYSNVVKEVAAKMDVCVNDDLFTIPSQIGNGYIKYKILTGSIQCLITDLN